MLPSVLGSHHVQHAACQADKAQTCCADWVVISVLSFSSTQLLGCFQAVPSTLVPGMPVSADIAIELLKESMICQEAIKHSHLSHPC
jgi:hypothetical protein